MSRIAWHYGKKVARQIMFEKQEYKKGLKFLGIEYCDLPLLIRKDPTEDPVEVITFIHAGIIKYGIMKHFKNADGKDRYHAYTTFSYPNDGDWLSLIEDVDNQIESGAPPMPMVSKARMLMDTAARNNVRILDARSACRRLRELGYTPDDLLQMDHWDMNLDSLNYLCQVDKELQKKEQEPCENRNRPAISI